jgi:hypothetical protein
MTELQIFAFVVLPVVVVALAWGAVVLNERLGSPPGNNHPGRSARQPAFNPTCIALYRAGAVIGIEP